MSLPTVGVISSRLGLPLHRVEYILRTRRIEPVGIAGTARVYDEAAVQRIAEVARRIDAFRGAAGAIDR